jgi:hypothetical protein
VEPGSLTRVLEVLGRQPGVIGGAIGTVFDSADPRLLIAEIANDVRAAVLGISFGDQIQFFRREPVQKLDLFPAIPLMEDVEMSLRLKRMGRQVYLFGSSVVSARRWRKGKLRRAALVIRLVGAYLWQRYLGQPDAPAMYRAYYGRDNKTEGSRR